jgi:hypothetical protein
VSLALIAAGVAVHMLWPNWQWDTIHVTAPGSTGLTVGTSVNHLVPSLPVSGDRYVAGGTRYAREAMAEPFGSASVVFVLDRRLGSVWEEVLAHPMSVGPGYTSVVQPFSVNGPGLYRAEFLVGGALENQRVFQVQL